MSDLAVIGLGAGLTAGFGGFWLAARIRELPAPAGIEAAVKARTRFWAYTCSIGGVVLAAGSVIAVPAVGILGALGVLAGLVGIPIAGIKWRRQLEEHGHVSSRKHSPAVRVTAAARRQDVIAERSVSRPRVLGISLGLIGILVGLAGVLSISWAIRVPLVAVLVVLMAVFVNAYPCRRGL